jgi:hypothetical protein
MPDWLLERIFPYTQQTLVSSKTILNMNTTTLKLIAVGVAGGLFGFVAARIYFHPSPAPHVPHVPHAQNEKSMKPAEPEKSVEPVDPPISSIEQIDTTNPFNNKKFDPILNDKEYVIGFMYKMEALKKSLTKPSVVEKKWRTAFPKTRDLLL